MVDNGCAVDRLTHVKYASFRGFSMRAVLSLLVVASLVSVSQAGVDFYSGTGSPTVFSLSGSPGTTTWNPIENNSTIGANKAGTSGTLVQLDGSFSTGGSTSPYDLYFSANAASAAANMRVFNSTSAPDATGIGTTVTFGSGSFTANSSTVLASSEVDIWNNSTLVSGWNGAQQNYVYWAAVDAVNGNTLFAIGWARVLYNGFTQSDTFQFTDWAYNLASGGGSSIVVGQTQLNNTGGAVPEPTGFAVLGLIGLAAGFKRRNRR